MIGRPNILQYTNKGIQEYRRYMEEYNRLLRLGIVVAGLNEEITIINQKEFILNENNRTI